MSSLVVDTHAAVWYLLESERLSRATGEAIDQALDSQENIFISSISVIEMIYIAEKGRLTQAAVESLVNVLSNADTGWILAPIDLGVAQAVGKISRDDVPDMPDRIIAATALHLALPLVTRDGKLRNSDLTTIW